MGKSTNRGNLGPIQGQYLSTGGVVKWQDCKNDCFHTWGGDTPEEVYQRFIDLMPGTQSGSHRKSSTIGHLGSDQCGPTGDVLWVIPLHICRFWFLVNSLSFFSFFFLMDWFLKSVNIISKKLSVAFLEVWVRFFKVSDFMK